MSTVAKVEVRTARQRAGQIREGIHNYLGTLALITQAWEQQDWRALAYDSWEAYVDGEFGETRLRLPRAHRDKAIEELRLAGMSTRAISAATGEPKSTVNDSIRQLSETGQLEQPEKALGRDGRTRASARPAAGRRAVDQPAGVPAEGLTPDLDDEAKDTSPPEAGDGASPPAGDSSRPARAGRAAELEPARPSPAVTDFLGSDESVQRAKYLHEFQKVLTRSDDFMEFDAEKLAENADLELVETLTSYLTRVSNFVERFQKARKERGGLRVLNGGRR